MGMNPSDTPETEVLARKIIRIANALTPIHSKAIADWLLESTTPNCDCDDCHDNVVYALEFLYNELYRAVSITDDMPDMRAVITTMPYQEANVRDEMAERLMSKISNGKKAVLALVEVEPDRLQLEIVMVEE